MNIKIAIPFIVVSILLSGGAAIFHVQRFGGLSELVGYSSGERVVEFREDGFYPNKITVRQDETVLFVNRSEGYFWPASNFHPVHTMYPEFDARGPIDSGKSWQFKFDKSGTWRYHDHMRPSFYGTIVVTNQNGEVVDIDCQNLTEVAAENKEYCWDGFLSRTLRQEGLKESLAAFARLYRTDPLFATSGCHFYAHRLGEEFYAQYHRKSKGIYKPYVAGRDTLLWVWFFPRVARTFVSGSSGCSRGKETV